MCYIVEVGARLGTFQKNKHWKKKMAKQNFQEIAQSATNYKSIIPEKVIRKKRGRASTRQEKRRVSIDSRIIIEQLSHSFALKEYKKEKSQYDKLLKEVGGRGIMDIEVPPFLAELKQKARLAEGNLKSAQISKAAMEAFPPL